MMKRWAFLGLFISFLSGSRTHEDFCYQQAEILIMDGTLYGNIVGTYKKYEKDGKKYARTGMPYDLILSFYPERMEEMERQILLKSVTAKGEETENTIHLGDKERDHSLHPRPISNFRMVIPKPIGS